MKCCASTDVRTWTNWLTFDPHPDYSPDAGTGLLSPLPYKRWYTEFYVGKIRRIRIGRCSDAWFKNGFIHWAVSHWNTFVGGTCAPSSALLVGHSVSSPVMNVSAETQVVTVKTILQNVGWVDRSKRAFALADIFQYLFWSFKLWQRVTTLPVGWQCETYSWATE